LELNKGVVFLENKNHACLSCMLCLTYIPFLLNKKNKILIYRGKISPQQRRHMYLYSFYSPRMLIEQKQMIACINSIVIVSYTYIQGIFFHNNAPTHKAIIAFFLGEHMSPRKHSS